MAAPTARRVIVGVSGGVDSSVSALLLKKSNRFQEVIGVFMRNWEPADETGDSYTCPAAADFADAERVCGEIGIPIHRVDFVKEYWTRVFEPYLERFGEGGTPNPDVFCNKEIKFKCFKAFVQDEFGSDSFLATGHYAQLRSAPDPTRPPLLLRGADPLKDQSYFLSAVSGEALRQVEFPVGGLPKSRVRAIAEEAGLCTASKKDSVGICFVGKRNFPEFISEYLDSRPGRFVGLDGKDFGPHEGLHHYTLGQRAGIGGLQEKMFVAAKNAKEGSILVVPGANHPALHSRELKIAADQMFWIAGEPPSTGPSWSMRAEAVVRYRQLPSPCTVIGSGDGYVRVAFDEPQSAVTPQQICAIYTGDVCLGGGIIEQTEALSQLEGQR